jgi:hypothetical protein
VGEALALIEGERTTLSTRISEVSRDLAAERRYRGAVAYMSTLLAEEPTAERLA